MAKCKFTRKTIEDLSGSKQIIFYRTIVQSIIEITRILHEEMDLKNRLKE